MADFRNIYGNDLVVRNLKNAVKFDRISHCYMICGEKGLGKRTIAKAFAKSIQCENKGEYPCGKCSSCIQVENENHPDVIYVRHEKPNTFSVDDIRDGLNKSVVIKPYKSEKKVYILEDGELLNQQAQNAMLKTIEEPPSYAVIIILSENSEAFLPTIKSRCVELNMSHVRDEELIKCLSKRGFETESRRNEILSFAAGNIGKAILYLEDEGYRELVKDVREVFFSICEADSAAIHDMVEKLGTYKGDISLVIQIFRRLFADLFLYKAGTVPIYEDNNAGKFMELSERYSFEDMPGIFSQMELFMSRLKVNVNFELSMEVMLMGLKPCSV